MFFSRFSVMCTGAAGSRSRMTTFTAWACVIAVLCSSIVQGGNKLHNRTVKSRYDEQRNFIGVAGAAAIWPLYASGYRIHREYREYNTTRIRYNEILPWPHIRRILRAFSGARSRNFSFRIPARQ